MTTTNVTASKRTKLTAKQEAFCVNYVILNNATQSAIKAGYSPATAQQISSEILLKPVIQARLAELRAAKPPDPDIADVEERHRILTKIARNPTEKPITAGQRITAIDTLNKLDKLYAPDTEVNLNIPVIIVTSVPRPGYKVIDGNSNQA
jgi:hypothetical protein